MRFLEIVVAAFLATLLTLLSLRYPLVFNRLLGRFQDASRHRAFVVLVTAVIPVVIRLLVLPWLAAPYPTIHDEFGHLLVADTLASGRLGNTLHPLSRHLETIYVLQQPSYSSIYPIGQGAVLAAGELLTGSAWAGVLLSVALMSGAISWMLYACLPPPWALTGGLLAALHFGLANDWVNSYWGGAFCAFGGSLLFGSLVRMRQAPSSGLAVVAGIGWSLVWFTRPFESSLLCAFLWAVIAAHIVRRPLQRHGWLRTVALIVSIQILAGGITLLHNRAVTGSPLTFPYLLSQTTYGVPQSFLGQELIEPPPGIRTPQQRSMYEWQRERKTRMEGKPAAGYVEVLEKSWEFFVTPWYSLPLLVSLFLLKDPHVVISVALLAGALVVSGLYPFFFPHYAAAYACVVFFLIMRGTIALSSWSFRGRLVGSYLALVFALGGALNGIPFAVLPAAFGQSSYAAVRPALREQVLRRLSALGGRHVVFVRYGSSHSFQDEWVYNAANVDDAPIVWGRSVGVEDDAEAIRYWRDRNAWLAIVENGSVRLSPYEPGREDAAAAFILEER